MPTSFEQRLIDACDRFLAARDRFVTEVLHAARDASVEAVERGFALALARRSRLASAPRNDASTTAEGASALPAPRLAPSVPTPTPASAPPASTAAQPELTPAALEPSTSVGIELSARAPEASA